MSMSFGPAFGSSDPFSEPLNRFLGMSPGSSPPAVQRVPIGRLLTEPARELINPAAQRAEEDGTSGLDPEHLLWVATKADQLADAIAGALPRGSGEAFTGPGLTPAAKRTLATAYAGWRRRA